MMARIAAQANRASPRTPQSLLLLGSLGQVLAKYSIGTRAVVMAQPSISVPPGTRARRLMAYQAMASPTRIATMSADQIGLVALDFCSKGMSENSSAIWLKPAAHSSITG